MYVGRAGLTQLANDTSLGEGAVPASAVVDIHHGTRPLNLDSNKSQRAMAMAIVHPEGGGVGGRGNKNQILKIDFTQDYLNKARYVLKHAHAVAMEVLVGDTQNQF